MFRIRITQSFLALVLATGVGLNAEDTWAEASGPDYYRVVDVSSNGALNMRVGPSTAYDVISKIPSETNGLANLGCQGGLTLQEWTNATDEEQNESRARRWCLVGYDRVIGWASGRYLSEGYGPDTFRGGERLYDLPGSEWHATRVGLSLVRNEVTLAFMARSGVAGNAACNRFNGLFSQQNGRLSFGPLAVTRRMCPKALMETEARFLTALKAVNRVVALHLVLALLDNRGEILVQFRRTDWD